MSKDSLSSSSQQLKEISCELWKISQEIRSLGSLFSGTGAFQFSSKELIGLGLWHERIHENLESYSAVLDNLSSDEINP